jgi:hypothetical protein
MAKTVVGIIPPISENSTALINCKSNMSHELAAKARKLLHSMAVNPVLNSVLGFQPRCNNIPAPKVPPRLASTTIETRTPATFKSIPCSTYMLGRNPVTVIH